MVPVAKQESYYCCGLLDFPVLRIWCLVLTDDLHPLSLYPIPIFSIKNIVLLGNYYSKEFLLRQYYYFPFCPWRPFLYMSYPLTCNTTTRCNVIHVMQYNLVSVGHEISQCFPQTEAFISHSLGSDPPTSACTAFKHSFLVSFLSFTLKICHILRAVPCECTMFSPAVLLLCRKYFIL